MVYLVYEGMQNMFLTDQPDFTHFKSVYSREMPFVSRTIEHPFDQTRTYLPGDTLISTLPRSGDYITGMSLKIVLPKLNTPSNTNWVWQLVPVIGDFMYGFDTSGNQLFTIVLNSRIPKTSTTDWFSASPGVTFSTSSNGTKFTFTAATTIDYVIFSNFETARLFGFLYQPIQLFGGYFKFDTNSSTVTSQVTFQECGWIATPNGNTYSYIDDICYKLIRTISLYIGKQLVQEFDSTSIKTYKETFTNYKNRPVLKLLEGDLNIVDFDRTYYFELPFIEIPMYAIPKHDVQIRLETNPLTDAEFYASLAVKFNTFSNVDKLPKNHIIPVKQLYYSNRPRCDIRGPVNVIYTRGDPNYTFYLNGEKFCDSDTSNIAAFENFVNVPLTSNVIVFDGPINMSRIRDQNFMSSNTVVYATVTNILAIENELAGLMFDYSDIRDSFPKVSSNARVEYTPPDPGPTYLFDEIPATASNVVSIYSMRRVSILYTGPVVRLRNSVTLAEDDFYTDENQTYLKNSDDISFTTWANGQSCVVTRWYDQSGNGNFFYDAAQAPIFTTQNGKYVLYFNNPSNSFTLSRYSMQSSTSIFSQQISFIHKPNTFLPTTRGDMLNSGARLTYTRDYNISSSPSMTIFNDNGSNSIGSVPLNTWSTLTAYAGSQFGPINLLCNTKQNIAIEVYTGYLFELGFFNGTTFSGAERTEYYNKSPF